MTNTPPWMPIQLSDRLCLAYRRKEFEPVLRVPFGIFDEDAAVRCRQYHDQTLEEIAGRGGFCAMEACAVLGLLDIKARGTAFGEHTAHKILKLARDLYCKPGVV